MSAMIGAIYAKLQADATGLDNGLRLGASKVVQFEKRATDRFRNVDRAMLKTGSIAGSLGAKLGDLAKSAGAGLAGLSGIGIGSIGVAGIVTGLQQVAQQVASIGDEAKRAGLSAGVFQQLGYVARQNRIDVDALVDGIKELNLRADEFVVTGGGSAADAFKRLGYGAADLKDKLKDPSALFTEIIGKLGALDRAAQIRIADEVFGGTGGEKFVQLIEQGADGMRRTMEEARATGKVLSDEVIAKADRANRTFAAMGETVGTAVNGALAEGSNLLAIFLDQFREIESRQYLRPLQNELAGVYGEIDTVKTSIANLQRLLAADGGENWQISFTISEAEKQLASLTERANQLLSRIQEIQGFQPPAPEAYGPPEDPRKALLAGMVGRGGPGRVTPPTPFYTPGEVEKTTSATTALTAATAAQTDAVDAQALAYQRVADQIEVAQGLATDFAGSLIDDLFAGKSGAEALSGAFTNLSKQLLQMAVNEAITGLFRNLLGSAMGGGFQPFGGSAITPRTGLMPLFDTGGFTGVGGKYDPAGVVHKGEYVFDAASVKRIGVGNLEKMRGYADGGYVTGSSMPSFPVNDFAANQNVVVNFSPNISVPAGTNRREIDAVLKEVEKRFRTNLPAMLAESRRRGGM